MNNERIIQKSNTASCSIILEYPDRSFEDQFDFWINFYSDILKISSRNSRRFLNEFYLVIPQPDIEYDFLVKLCSDGQIAGESRAKKIVKKQFSHIWKYIYWFIYSSASFAMLLLFYCYTISATILQQLSLLSPLSSLSPSPHLSPSPSPPRHLR